MKYRNYSDEDIKKAVELSYSFAETLKKLDLVSAGGNYEQLKKNITRLEINTDHFKGMGWNRGLFLKSYENYGSSESLKKRLISERGHKCENCLRDTWEEKCIPLELHHIDCNRLNNSSLNLQLLCPNCHTLTDGYRRRKT